jgi:chromosome segregation ATPase
MPIHLGCIAHDRHNTKETLGRWADKERNMAKDDLTQKLPNNDEDRTTQPTLIALLALVREVKESVDRGYADLSAQITQVRADVTQLSARLDQVELRLSRDITGLGYKIEALNKSRLQTEADYSSLFDRVTVLESKIP